MFASCSLVFPEFSFFATLLFFPENYVTLRLWSIHRFFTIIIFSETIFNVQLGINNHLRAPAILLVFWRIYEYIFKSCSLLNRSYFFLVFRASDARSGRGARDTRDRKEVFRAPRSLHVRLRSPVKRQNSHSNWCLLFGTKGRFAAQETKTKSRGEE